MIRRITCVQIDPINVVARTQLLVPFSRLGPYDPADLEALLWDDKALFETTICGRSWSACATAKCSSNVNSAGNTAAET